MSQFWKDDIDYMVTDDDTSTSDKGSKLYMHTYISHEETCKRLKALQEKRSKYVFNKTFRQRIIRNGIIIILAFLSYIYYNPFTNNYDTGLMIIISFLLSLFCAFTIGFSIKGIKMDIEIYNLEKLKLIYEKHWSS